jgi:aldehyde dehydrogenase (NAD(P)+)
MASLTVQLTAPNGRIWSQPTGLFINNKWVKSSDGEKIASINPSYVSQLGF